MPSIPMHQVTYQKALGLRNNLSNGVMVTLSESVNRHIDYNQQLGLHPDFEHLKGTDIIEEHYIVSSFIDIKGSTNLFKKFDKQTVFLITNTILKAGIHTMLIFGGYVHRLQGDGLFVYFGDKCNLGQLWDRGNKRSYYMQPPHQPGK